MRRREQDLAIRSAIREDTQKFSVFLTETYSQRLNKDSLKVAGEYGVDVIKGIKGEGNFNFQTLTPEGVKTDSLKIADVIEQLREESKVVRGEGDSERIIYVSRPLLTAITVGALIGNQMRIRAHTTINNSQSDESIAKFFGMHSAGEWAYDASESIDRAEGALRKGARIEALSMDSAVVEPELARKTELFQSYADALVVDKTGIKVIETSFSNTLRRRYGPEALSTQNSGISELRLAGEFLAVEAYKLIYEKTAPKG